MSFLNADSLGILISIFSIGRMLLELDNIQKNVYIRKEYHYKYENIKGKLEQLLIIIQNIDNEYM